MEKIKVLIIDDSKLMQQILSQILSSDPEIHVVGVAADPLLARELIKKKKPDVLTLDIMLPYLDGVTFLKNLMHLHPLPVVMISALTESANAVALECLSLGAVDYFPKPTQKEIEEPTQYGRTLITIIKNAAKAKVIQGINPPLITKKLEKVIANSELLRKEIIAIGASTGGIEAIESILTQLPQIVPPILIVQHIKKEFSTAFTKRISKLYGLTVVEGENYTEMLPGYIYMAPGGKHLTIKKRKGHYYTRLNDEPPVNGHKPSIDVLFSSIAETAGPDSIGILLTGMGSDGAIGLKAMRKAGAVTIAQNEETSVVWGMPGAAVKIDAAEFILPLNKIAQKILDVIEQKGAKFRVKSSEV